MNEVIAAYDGGEGVKRVCEEAIDAIIAIDNFIEKMPDDEVKAAYKLVLNKGTRRGDWL